MHISARPALALATVLLALAGATTALLLPESPPRPGTSLPEDDPRPRAVVALGDSAASGEGAGDYVAGTRGENGDFCHRSPHAMVHQLGRSGMNTMINLACSGARIENVGLDGPTHFTEGSQVRALAEQAHRHRVEAVVVQVGANDEPKFAETLVTCVRSWADRKGCSAGLAGTWPSRVRAVVPKIGKVLDDVRATMRQAGYPDNSYALVALSYAGPLGPDARPELRDLSGCPFTTADLTWMRERAVVELAEGTRRAATRSGARFLDLSQAGRGREACTVAGGRGEWFTRLVVDWHLLQEASESSDPIARNSSGQAVNESFHPNAEGHRQLGGCLREFLATTVPEARCVPVPGNRLLPRPLSS
jgi:lysophospholipase L1-like esterase